MTIHVVKGNNQDINGDGYPDIVMGDSSYNNYDGRAYVFLSHGNSGLNAASLSAVNADTILSGELNTEGEFGNAITLDDINGDGYADVMIGADSNIVCIRCFVGRVYAFYSQGSTGLGSAQISAIRASANAVSLPVRA